MAYTIQVFVAGYGHPDGRDVVYVNNLRDAKFHLSAYHEEAEQVGAGYEPSTAYLWKGEHKDVTDMYPDFVLTMGPRGGIHHAPC